MHQMQIIKKRYRPKKTKKVRKKRSFGAPKCKLCGDSSSFLVVEKFCRCVTEPDHFIEKEMTINGVLQIVKLVSPSLKRLLKEKYKHLIEKKEAAIKPNAAPKKTKEKPLIKPVKQVSRTVRHEFYDSREWRELRYETLVKYGRKCMLCYATDIEVHCDHIKPMSKHWDLRLDPDNIQVLCKDCNLGKSNHSCEDFRQ